MHGEWKNKIRFSFYSLTFVNNVVIHWRDLIFFLISPHSLFTIFFFFFENHEKGCDNLSYFIIESPKVLWYYCQDAFTILIAMDINKKKLDIPKINLNSRRQYTNFTYKPHIIKAILLTTKYNKEENVTEN